MRLRIVDLEPQTGGDTNNNLDINNLGPGVDTYNGEIIYAQNNGSIPGLSKIVIDQIKDQRAGSGGFAIRDFQANEIVEVCPLVKIPYEHIKNNELNDYVFSLKGGADEGYTACVLGYGAVYNHDDNPSLTYEYTDNKKFMVYKTTRAVNNGDELTVSYGQNWWNVRNKYKVNNVN